MRTPLKRESAVGCKLLDLFGFDQDFLGGKALFDHGQYVLGVWHDDFKDIGAIVDDHLFDCRAEVLTFNNAPTGYAETFGDFDEIRVDGI